MDKQTWLVIGHDEGYNFTMNNQENNLSLSVSRPKVKTQTIQYQMENTTLCQTYQSQTRCQVCIWGKIPLITISNTQTTEQEIRAHIHMQTMTEIPSF